MLNVIRKCSVYIRWEKSTSHNLISCYISLVFVFLCSLYLLLCQLKCKIWLHVSSELSRDPVSCSMKSPFSFLWPPSCDVPKAPLSQRIQTQGAVILPSALWREPWRIRSAHCGCACCSYLGVLFGLRCNCALLPWAIPTSAVTPGQGIGLPWCWKSSSSPCPMPTWLWLLL